MPQRSNYVLIFLIAGLAAAALAVPTFSNSEAFVHQGLLRGLSEARIGDGRFFRSSTLPFDSARYERSLSEAELFLLSAEESVANTQLRALLDVGSGNLHGAAESLEKLSDALPENAEILNDLGVVYLGLGDENATNYFKAATLFERSAKANPRAPVPRFNAALAFEKAQLRDFADRELKEFKRLASRANWSHDSASVITPTPLSLIDHLRRVLDSADMTAAKTLIDRYPLEYRKAAMDFALNPLEGEESSATSPLC